MNSILHITLYLLCFCSNACFSQALTSSIKYQLEFGAYLSTSGTLPFWLRSNQNGIVPLKSPTLTFRGYAHKEYDSTKNENQKIKKLGIGYGFWGVANVGKQIGLLLPEAYLKVRYGVFEFYCGRKREIIGLVDTTLTSGSYIWSGNALPMPKIQISIPNYTSIIGHGLISIKGSFTHGWFGNQTFTENYYLHQKSVYGRVGKPKWKINLFGGFNHQVQWGGYSESLINNNNASQNGFLPSDLNTFINIVFPFSFIRKAFPAKIKLKYDSDNYGGNQLGSVDFAGEIRLKKLKLLVYRQLPYELGSLFSSLVNADDGLYGMSIKFNKPIFSINRFTIEGFHSFNQGAYRSGIARLLNLKDKHFGELHGYFNHGQYWDGWSFNNTGIGTPLILSNQEISPLIKPTIGSTFSSYNKVKSIIGLVEGSFKQYQYGLKSNYAIYRPTGYTEFTQNISQFSFNIFTKFKTRKDFTVILSYAFDKGEILNNSHGIAFSLLKSWY